MMLSQVAGSVDTPLLDITIGAALDAAAARWADRPAVVDRGRSTRLRWDELGNRVAALAAGFLDLGLSPGDRIGIWSLNRIEWVLTQFAAAKAGLILVTINPAYRLAELEHALVQSGCRAIVVSPPFKTSDFPGLLGALLPELTGTAGAPLAAPRFPDLRHVIGMDGVVLDGALPFADVESRGVVAGPDRLAAVAARLSPDDPINIQFTSGTTGTPKGVTLSHRNILNNGYFTGRGIGLCDDDRLCIPVPLYHCFGLSMGNLACLTHGATMVYPGEGFDPLATLEAVAAERCTILYGVPTMFIAELDHPRFADFDLSSLRGGIMAGSPCPVAVMRRVAGDMHMGEVTIAYGMTETSPVSFQSAIDDTLERRVSTVGRVHPHVEVKVVDPDGTTVARGTAGELCTRGYSVMLGYWGDPDHTAAVRDAQGWVRTGDLATIDDEGFCNIVGRLKDMVIRGGENLYPREIEEYLHRHPAIRDVQVFGVPDDRYGEEVCAWVVLHEGQALDEHGLRDFCRGRIAHQKVPRYVRFVEGFPLTVTGKVQKFMMRDSMIADLALNIVETA